MLKTHELLQPRFYEASDAQRGVDIDLELAQIALHTTYDETGSSASEHDECEASEIIQIKSQDVMIQDVDLEQVSYATRAKKNKNNPFIPNITQLKAISHFVDVSEALHARSQDGKANAVLATKKINEMVLGANARTSSSERAALVKFSIRLSLDYIESLYPNAYGNLSIRERALIHRAVNDLERISLMPLMCGRAKEPCVMLAMLMTASKIEKILIQKTPASSETFTY